MIASFISYSTVGERQNVVGRRVIVALFCVAAAFVCVIIQTMNFFDDVYVHEPIFDSLLHGKRCHVCVHCIAFMNYVLLIYI